MSIGIFVENKNSSSTAFTHIYQGVTQNELETLIEKQFASRKYRKDLKSTGQIIYIRGSRLKRMMWGAFTKYFKYRVVIKPEGEDKFSVLITSDSSGMSGGLIGMNQVKKETQALFQLFKEFI